MSADQATSTILFDAALDYAIASSDMSLRSRRAFVAGAEWQWARVSDSAAKIERLTAENNELRTGEYLVKVIEERERLRKELEDANACLALIRYAMQTKVVEINA